MRYYSSIVILFLFATLGCDNSVTVIPTFEDHFVKYFGLGGNQSSSDLLSLSDGFILVGNSNETGDNSQVYVVRTDLEGNELWSRTMGGSDDEFAVSISENLGNGFVIASNVVNSVGSSDIKLYLISSTGVPTDSATFGSAQFSESAREVVTISDGGFIVMAETTEVQSPKTRAIYMIRTLPGSLSLAPSTWEDNQSIGNECRAGGVVEFVADQFWALGYSNYSTNLPQGLSGFNLILIPLDEFGEQYTFQPYGTTDNQNAQKIIRVEGGVVLLGNTVKTGDTDIFIQKISGGLNGSQQMVLTNNGSINITNGNIAAKDIVDAGTGFIVLGTKTLNVDDKNIYLTSMDKFGNQLWERTYGGTSMDTSSSGLTLLNDGSIVFAGTVQLGNQTKMALFKTNANGDLNP